MDTLFANVGCSSACYWYTITIMMLLEWRIICEEEMKIYYYYYYQLLLLLLVDIIIIFLLLSYISDYFHFNYDAVVIGASAAEEEYKKK